MKTTATAVFLISFGTVLIASVVVTRKLLTKLEKDPKNRMSSEEYRLRTELIAWLLTAPIRGYSGEEIARYYNEQKEFIDLIKHNS